MITPALPAPGSWQGSPLSALLLVATVLSIAIVVIVNRRRLMPGTVPFTLLMMAAAEWAAMAALEHAAVEPAAKVLFAELEYPGIVSVAPLWLMFALAYTGRDTRLTPGRIALLWIVPVATVALVWTNQWHRLVWTTITPSSATPGAPLVYGHGPAFWAAVAYNYALNVAGTAILIAAAVRLPRPYRRQSAALLTGLALPWLGNALYLGGWHVVRGDPTPLAFALTGVVYVFGVFRLGLFDVVPVARHLVIEHMADGVMVLDVHNRIVDINPSARAMLGIGNTPVIGVVAGRILAQWPDIVARYRDVPEAQEELRLDGADGLRYLDLRISPLRDRSARLKGRLIVVSDVTARRRTEEALRQNEKLASLGQLLAGVAHELNNPLSVIVGHTTLLLRANLGDAGAAARVEKIATAAERCGRIVKSFLAIARQRVTEHSTTDVNRVLHEAVDFLAYQLDVDEVAVTFDLARELPPIWADPHQLHQVVLNLLTNARHALRAVNGPRRVVISSRYDPARERVRFTIADNGPGIPVALRHRIFEPFFTTKSAGMGSGLGLSVCRGIIAAHEGSIAVETADGGGAAFVVELPLATGASATVHEEPRERADVIRGKRILLVDDEITVAEVLAELLAFDDHEVTIAGNGAIALELLEAQRFDLVISDLRMPVLDGPALYRRLQLQDPGIRDRFVFLTGDTLSADTNAFLHSTGAATLTKPFEGEVVRRVVQDTLRNAAAP